MSGVPSERRGGVGVAVVGLIGLDLVMDTWYIIPAEIYFPFFEPAHEITTYVLIRQWIAVDVLCM